eukprot:CAMPEP_0206592084 /NCGR_PEP_ID=MMETSP0325_2-20121206/40702_1 /ASSEMBLY_ACC=CAM_ASM_000347 /TAXON_ID=2866 /ORGANISM="Crypthecodinium cohnii, Strain Seligo" /LENGTH=129 /DNA_ID=CAMNT_0054101555 /DNA_START=98 /DNA_END=487 /DNA_ORIENTATION=+
MFNKERRSDSSDDKDSIARSSAPRRSGAEVRRLVPVNGILGPSPRSELAFIRLSTRPFMSSSTLDSLLSMSMDLKKEQTLAMLRASSQSAEVPIRPMKSGAIYSHFATHLTHWSTSWQDMASASRLPLP